VWPLEYNTIVVLVGTSLLGASAGLVGSFAVLRRRALLGDALSHAALPGLCLAFLVVGQRSLAAMLCGAFLSGLLGVAVVAGLRRFTRIKEDAAIGIVLSVFFGAGVVLSRMIQNQSTTGSKAGLDSYILGKTAGMIAADVYLIASVAAACLLVLMLLYKEFKLVAFDTGFAAVQGWPAGWLDLLLMALVALTVVIGLPAVGVVLMAALLIIPGAAARFWTDSLGVMLALSAAFGLAVGATGTLVSANYGRMPAGPVIVLVGTALFLVSIMLAPRRGAIARWLDHRVFRHQLERQRLLRSLFDVHEALPAGIAAIDHRRLLSRSARSAARLDRLIAEFERDGLVRATGANQLILTERGLAEAARLARGFRLWELFLTEHADLSGSFRELDATSLDRLLPAALVEELEDKLAAAGRLPHVPGKPTEDSS